ncbi:MAG: glycosyltransferase family 10, partial [Armatimonadota bacterium]|nr:glycosyltransferase family 10 [Armatimonadota bacterium]
MSLIRVKLSTNFPELPLIRQTPGRAGVWGNCRFFINEPVEECDFWVVYEDVLQPETTRCPPENTLVIMGEPPSVRQYDRRFTAQFAQALTCRRAMKHPGAIYHQQALPWMVGWRYYRETSQWDTACTKDYDELAALPPIPKTRRLSVISSDKAFTPGHRQRLEFVHRLKQHFGDEIDVFGRGLRDFEDKWDVLAPYQYHVILENGQFPDYWTEKLSDALLAGAYPFYGGCPNIGDYFAGDVLTRRDISQPAQAIEAIVAGLDAHRFEATVAARAEAVRRI